MSRTHNEPSEPNSTSAAAFGMAKGPVEETTKFERTCVVVPGKVYAHDFVAKFLASLRKEIAEIHRIQGNGDDVVGFCYGSSEKKYDYKCQTLVHWIPPSHEAQRSSFSNGRKHTRRIVPTPLVLPYYVPNSKHGNKGGADTFFRPGSGWLNEKLHSAGGPCSFCVLLYEFGLMFAGEKRSMRRIILWMAALLMAASALQVRIVNAQTKEEVTVSKTESPKAEQFKPEQQASKGSVTVKGTLDQLRRVRGHAGGAPERLGRRAAKPGQGRQEPAGGSQHVLRGVLQVGQQGCRSGR